MTNFGWNYPPGTNVNARQIAGTPEREETVECRGVAVVHYRHQLQDEVALAARHGRPVDLNHLDTQDIDCEWSGKVEGYVDGFDFEWECPRCGNTQVEDGYFEPDPDEGRDW